MEISMHGRFDRSRDPGDDRIESRWGVGLLVLPAVVAIVLIGLAITQPTASNWISAAVQAELAATGFSPEVAPTQLAKPAGGMRAVRAN
jgi:spore maturation protein SpmB